MVAPVLQTGLVILKFFMIATSQLCGLKPFQKFIRYLEKMFQKRGNFVMWWGNNRTIVTFLASQIFLMTRVMSTNFM